jgi:hypothetical protein
MLPAYLFRTTLNSPLARSAANSRPRVRSLSRGRSTLTTRCQFTIQNSQANRLRPLPFGMSSRQIIALRLRRTREACLNVGPIFPSLPETGDREIHRLVPGSSLQVRYLHQAYCSVYLLEPPSGCTKSISRSSVNQARRRHFHEFFLLWNHYFTEKPLCERCE